MTRRPGRLGGFFPADSKAFPEGRPRTRCGVVAVIEEHGRAGVQGGDPVHFVIGEFEVEDVEVFGHAIGAHGLRDDDDITLDQPAQHGLGDGLAVCAPISVRVGLVNRSRFCGATMTFAASVGSAGPSGRLRWASTGRLHETWCGQGWPSRRGQPAGGTISRTDISLSFDVVLSQR